METATAGRPQPIRHGTIGGYRTHYRRRVLVCEPCREADRRYRGLQSRKIAQHGTTGGYARHLRLCQVACEPCLQAHREANRRGQAARAARGLPAGDPRHGTTSAYSNWGCRCALCAAVKSEHSQSYRQYHQTRNTPS